MTLQRQWEAYKHANEMFARVVLEHYDAHSHSEDEHEDSHAHNTTTNNNGNGCNDLVWCHDYHLLLLPELLKQRVPTMKVSQRTSHVYENSYHELLLFLVIIIYNMYIHFLLSFYIYMIRLVGSFTLLFLRPRFTAHYLSVKRFCGEY